METNSPKIYPKCEKRREIATALALQNVSTADIAKVTKYHPDYVSQLKSKAKKNPLLTKKRLKAALKTFDYFNDLENYKQDDRIKPSDVMKPVERILNEHWPQVSYIQQDVHTESVNISTNTISEIQSYLKALPIEIENDKQPILIDNTGIDKQLESVNEINHIEVAK